eukprot:1755958-Rhodomonas_salina.1
MSESSHSCIPSSLSFTRTTVFTAAVTRRRQYRRTFSNCPLRLKPFPSNPPVTPNASAAAPPG